MQDKIYVKAMLLYHGGTLFGRVNDDPKSLAKTVLGVMISCIFSGPIQGLIQKEKVDID